MDAQAGMDPCRSQAHYVGFVMSGSLISIFKFEQTSSKTYSNMSNHHQLNTLYILLMISFAKNMFKASMM
jgi:hypothetical protein